MTRPDPLTAKVSSLFSASSTPDDLVPGEWARFRELVLLGEVDTPVCPCNGFGAWPHEMISTGPGRVPGRC